MDTAWSSIERDSEAVSTGDVDLEAQLSWNGDVLAVVHAPLTRGRVLRVRDLGLPGADTDMVIARNVRGTCELVLPGGLPVEAGHRLRLRVATVSMRLALVARTTEKLPPSRGDGRLARAYAGAGLLHAVLLALAFLGRATIDVEEQEAFATLRGLAMESQDGDGTGDHASSGAAGEGAPRAPTAMPAPVAALAHGDGVTRKGRDETREEARSFGMIALLDRTAATARPFGEGSLDRGGALFDPGQPSRDLPGDGLSGTGEGGGGRGEGIGIGGIGGLGHGAGFGSGVGGCGGCSAFGTGRLGGTHVTRAPTIRCGEDAAEDAKVAHCDVMVNGRLPPEVIQRVVRQSFGRFRACYESGLARNPSLEGRVEVKFVIDRAGAVASATAMGLADADVSRCVSRAYEAMSFPEPQGGIVTVVYPLVFSSAPV